MMCVSLSLSLSLSHTYEPGQVGAIWTYNQGVLLSGLAALAAHTQNASLLGQADALVSAVVRHMTAPAWQGPDHGADGRLGGGDPGRVLVEKSCTISASS
jgi:predicted alpha-1,6-mannanase (GH76 family)